MKLDPTSVKEFQEIWKKEFGEEIPYETAEGEAQNLLDLFRLLIRP